MLEMCLRLKSEFAIKCLILYWQEGHELRE